MRYFARICAHARSWREFAKCRFAHFPSFFSVHVDTYVIFSTCAISVVHVRVSFVWMSFGSVPHPNLGVLFSACISVTCGMGKASVHSRCLLCHSTILAVLIC